MKSKLKKSETSLVAVISDESVGSSNCVTSRRDDIDLISDRLTTATMLATSSISSSLLLLNRTNSNSSCNSDSDYNSANSSASLSSASASASCSPSPQPSLVVKPSRSTGGARSPRIISGFYGKAKSMSNSSNESELLVRSTSNESSNINANNNNNTNDEIITNTDTFINYGDDVGFIVMPSSSSSSSDDITSSSNSSINRSISSGGSSINNSEYIYFGIADGVSANRLRGYDARLFPVALLTSCVKFIKEDPHEYVQGDLERCKKESNVTVGGDEQSKKNSDLEKTKQPQQIEGNVVENVANDDDVVKIEEENEEVEEEEENGDEEQEEDYINQDCDNILVNVTSTPHEMVVLGGGGENLSLSSDDSQLSFGCQYLYSTLIKAHNLVQEQKIYGSSTVCLLSLRFDTFEETSVDVEEGFCFDIDFVDRTRGAPTTAAYQSGGGGGAEILLSTCNLGDSGYMVIRSGQCVFKSQSQSHRFNAPYQIGCTPPELLDHDLYRDSPEDSISMTHSLKSGDFLLISSDGLFDNLYEDEIALLVDKHVRSAASSASIQPVHASRHDESNSDDDNEDDQLKPIIRSNSSSNSKKTVNNPNHHITSELLSSACGILVERASLGKLLFHKY